MDFGLRTPVELRTRLTRTEVIDRLKRSVDEPSWWATMWGGSGMVGRVGPDRCWFENGSFRQRVARQLRLRFVDGPDGTVLRGEFVVPAIQLVPLIVFFGISGCMGLLALVHLLFGTGGDWRVLLLALAIPLGAFGILKFNLWMASRREAELVETIEELLKGPSRWVAGCDPFGEGEMVIRPKVREPRVWNR